MSWMGHKIKAARSFVARMSGWAVTLFLAATILLGIFSELHMLGERQENPFILLVILGAMIFFLKHDVAESHDDLTRKVGASHEALAAKVAEETRAMQHVTARIETAQGQIETSVGALSADVGLMRETLHSGGKLRTLEQAMSDLAPRFAAVRSGQEVVIDHLGLNMSAAWDRLCPVLESLVHDKQARVRFRLLILGEDGSGGVEGAGRTVALPEVVMEDWIPGISARRRQIERELREIQANAAGAGALDPEVRGYRDLPVVHGIFIRIGAFEAAYVAICRWNARKAEKFWWGGDEYHRVLGPASQEQRDLMEILKGYFERWWLMNKPPAPPAPARQTRKAKKAAAAKS